MGHSGLIVVFILGTAVLGYVGGQELATEAPTGGQTWALCPPDDSPASSQEGELPVQPRFSSCMVRCTSHAYEAFMAMLVTGEFKSMTTSLKLNEGRQGEREGPGTGARLLLDASSAANQTEAGDGLGDSALEHWQLCNSCRAVPKALSSWVCVLKSEGVILCGLKSYYLLLSTGPDHEFCWMLHLRCQSGVRLIKAFVLLNLEQPLGQSQPFPLRLLLTAPTWPNPLLQPRSKRRYTRLLNAEACGIRFDVTQPFRDAEGGREAEMCVKVVCPEGDACEAMQLSLRCPLFLATLWRTLPRPDG
ncbi:hypothetical protein Chor_005163 [Crotalus horridus]